VSSSLDLRYLRFWQALAWLAVIVVVTLTVMREPPQVAIPLLSWDKAQHVVAYAGLMWWFRQAFRGRALWLILLPTMGILLEGVQRLTDARHFEFLDMLANLVGLACGALLAATPLGRTLRWADQSILVRTFQRRS
jgi:hypothetical protein